jgi:MoaA/NifB/PqqE/SkfB family radical SAM enzyme
MSNWQHQAKNNPYFCILPFNHMHMSTEGRANACCVAHHAMPIAKSVVGKTFPEIWTSEEYKTLRSEMLSGQRPARCEICYKQDEEGGGSDRQTHNRYFNPPVADWDIDIEKGNTEGHPVWVDLRPGRFCNLGCRMCFVSTSSKVADDHKLHPELTDITGEGWFDINEWIDDPKMYASLQELIPTLSSIKLAGGEPLFMPGVIKLLRWCVESNNTHLSLDITTNGTRTNGKIISWLDKFKSVFIQFSIDGVGYTNDYIRWPSDWESIDKAYDMYTATNNVETLNILSTVQVYNIFDLPNIIDYWKNKGAHDNLVFNFVNWPKDLCIDILPLNDRLDIAEKIEEKTSDLPHDVRQQCRVDALLFRLRQQSEPSDIDSLRLKFAKRTMKYDELRTQDISRVHIKLKEYVEQWIQIKNPK